MRVLTHLLKVAQTKEAGFLVLLDPDRRDRSTLVKMAEEAAQAGADALLVGSSLLLHEGLDELLGEIKPRVSLPLILFPGNSSQLSHHADAIFFLCLVSGRNPELLIGEHVRAAPHIRHLGLEPISVGYMLVESGQLSSVEYMSNTRPIPRGKVDIAMAHALAAEYLGMKMLYLDCGSGVKQHVPEEMIRAVKDYVTLPLIVGGGITTPGVARRKVKAGADFIVIGSAIERQNGPRALREFSRAVHGE